MDYRKAMNEAMAYCTTLPNFRCGLFICTEAEYDVVCELIDGYKNNFEIKQSKKGLGWLLAFDNGSVMYIMRFNNDVNNRLCATRLHIAYISEKIEQEVIDTIVSPMMILYQLMDVIKVIGAGK